MKKLLLIYLVLCFSNCTSNANANIGQVKKLQDEIKTLIRQISELQKTITSQKQEIEKLKSLCQENGIDTNPKAKPQKPTESAIRLVGWGLTPRGFPSITTRAPLGLRRKGGTRFYKDRAGTRHEIEQY